MSRVRWLLSVAVVVFVFWSATAGAAPTEVKLWTTWGPESASGKALTHVIDEFNTKQSGVHVSVEVMNGALDEKVVLAYTSGSAPDIILGGVARYALQFGGEGGMFLPLDRYMDGPDGIPRDGFVSDMWVTSVVDGKTYQLALDGNERALFINADEAQAAGLDVGSPAPVKDWDDLLAWARKLTRTSGSEVSQWGFNANQQNNGDRLHWMWLNGGAAWNADRTAADLDNPRNVEAVRFAAQMIHEYQVAPAPDAYSGSALSNFRSGHFAMFIGNSNHVEPLHEAGLNFITVPGPPGRGATVGRFAGATSSTVQVLSSTKHPDEAWRVVRRLVYERAPEITAVRGIPYLIDSLKAEKFRSQPWQAFARSMLTYEGRNQLVKGFEGGKYWGVIEDTWMSVMRGEKDPSVALKEAAGPINAMLQEWRSHE